MGFDTLVDATELESNLTTVADSIRAKTGQSETLAFPDGMVSAINSIQTTPSNLQQLSSLANGFATASMPENFTLDVSFSNSSTFSFYQTFRQCSGLKQVIIIPPNKSKIAVGLSFFDVGNTLTKITFQGNFTFAKTISSVYGQVALGAFANSTGLEEIVSSTPLGATFMSNADSYYNPLFNCSALKEVRFERGAASDGDWVFKWSPNLSDETLISMGNALNLTGSSTVLTLHPTAYARCAQIKGREDTDVEGECFIADENGDITLETYITENKGWSLANA